MGETLLSREELIDLLMRAAEHAYYAVLVGNPTPNQKQLLERIRDCRIGDLVVEETTCRGRRRRDPDASPVDSIGWLLEHRREMPDRSVSAWVEEGYAIGDKLPDAEIWYIETLNGNVCRWENASFRSIPIEMDLASQDGTLRNEGYVFDVAEAKRKHDLSPPDGLIIAPAGGCILEESAADRDDVTQVAQAP